MRLLSCLIVPPLAAALVFLSCSKQNRELSETLQWMDNTYNPHETWSYGHGKTGWYAPDKSGQSAEILVWGSTETFTYNGCDLKLRIEDSPQDTAHQSVQGSYLYSFNLRDINPQSIKLNTYSHMGDFRCEDYKPDELGNMRCDHARIAFSTHTEAPLINVETHAVYPGLQGKDHTSYSKKKDTSAFFNVDDVQYAPRFAKAFRHAVELCGGKASPF
jgi:hypothetical protein